MSAPVRTRRALLLAVLLGGLLLGGGLAGCLDGGSEDGASGAGDGAGDLDEPGDDPGDGTLTFAEFVIDLIQNHTADDTEPVAIDFSLPDDEDPDAFEELF